jgi:hypothetical protein
MSKPTINISVGGNFDFTVNGGSAQASDQVRDFIADDKSLQPSEVEDWNSGGTAGILPAERELASFDTETMTRFLGGGMKEAIRRRWIMGSSEELAEEDHDYGGKSTKYDLERSGKDGAVASNFIHFMEIHKTHLDKMYVPQGNEM